MKSPNSIEAVFHCYYDAAKILLALPPQRLTPEFLRKVRETPEVLEQSIQDMLNTIKVEVEVNV